MYWEAQGGYILGDLKCEGVWILGIFCCCGCELLKVAKKVVYIVYGRYVVNIFLLDMMSIF
jgi:hypothetical protein